ncbi:PAS domain-containing hybrid sensor histidine kinase/response regulator [Desulfonatronum lacustre]|uniref:PAS domain-containing hybrid sensor histidine kinase/response regulator n=1 Tax=Desulfonatronum lacustre TaxID=66849 RepID=UPI00146FA3E4|nr:PAS domain-containing hybrid sensor histidine kinase/response regulator [Desulfonatronum lacustre]
MPEQNTQNDSDPLPGFDLQDIFDNAPIGIFTSTPEGRFISANPSIARIQGYDSPEELIESVTDIAAQVYADPEDRKEFIRLLEEHGEVVNHECRFRRRDGTAYWVSSSVRTLRNSEGRIVAYQGFTTDISERKRIERHYQDLLENINDVVFFVDLDGRITYLSPSAKNFMGEKAVDLLGRNFRELIDPRDIPLIEHAWENVLRGRLEPDQYRLCLEPGETLWVRTSSRPMVKDGVVVGIVGVLTDITEQKRAEDALRESEARFRSLLEHIPTVAVQGYGMDGVTLFWNKASEKFYGYSQDEAIGKNLVDLIIPDDMRANVVQEIKSMSETRRPLPSAELHLRRKDGSRIPVYSSHAIIQRPGQPPEMFCIDVDLTELKLAEGALLAAKKQAEAASKAKSEFLANMSHEIRTPLNGIMGMMQLLETTTLDADQRQYVQLCTSSANRLTRLLSDILDLSRVEAGKLTIHEAEFVVQELADSVSGLFTFNARGKGVALECSVDPAVPSRLIGDEARVRQILFNLVGNSLKFTDKGHVRVEMTSLASDKNDSANVLFTVTDTGIGIPEYEVKNLFDSFFQVDGSYTRNFQGAGLGLAIVKRLVDLLGGKVTVKSDVGKGTSMRVLLPFKLPGGMGIPGQGEMTGQHHEAKHRLRILLVEDEPSNALPIRKLLEKAGHTVTLAKDGQQALDLFKDQDFDLILMDIQMPVMNGVEATKGIRSSTDLGPKKDIPIIALTAYAMFGDKEKFLEAGMDDYLAKPVRMEDLEKVLEKHLRTIQNMEE